MERLGKLGRKVIRATPLLHGDSFRRGKIELKPLEDCSGLGGGSRENPTKWGTQNGGDYRQVGLLPRGLAWHGGLMVRSHRVSS